MDVESAYLSMLVALNAALLLILAGLAKKRLEWRAPVLPVEARRARTWPVQPWLLGLIALLVIGLAAR
jgi:hypothetical protein